MIVNYCIDCKHHLKLNTGRYCCKGAETTTSLVTGFREYDYSQLKPCSYSRESSHLCGIDGRFFEPRKRI